MTGAATTVRVPADRVERWAENFGRRHGAVELAVAGGELHGTAADGSTFVARLPFERDYDGPAVATTLADAVRDAAPDDWGVLLVRKGGFAVARVAGPTIRDSKVGRRHVQGRTKAGGQSQQRFARRRDNQARQAYEAAAEHAVRILDGLRGPLVTGGDRAAVAEVLEDRRLTAPAVTGPWLDVPDPRRTVLQQAVTDALGAEVSVVNAD